MSPSTQQPYPEQRSAPALRDPAPTRTGFRLAIKALTPRGRAFIAGGLTAALCALVLGERDLLRVGALILLIPLTTATVTALSGQRLGLVRRVASPVVEVGQSTSVFLDLNNLGRRTGLLMLEEQVPWALGQRPRFLVGWLGAGKSRHVQYSVHAEVRGSYEIGPLRVRVGDPFGMLSMHRAFPRTTQLVVVPATESLPRIGSIGSGTGTGDNRPQPFTVGNAADTTVREYRLGDDLRRVHWPSSARTGELMVRREEQPWQSRGTVYVDNRASAHRGSGPESSLERTIAVAASIAVHLQSQGYQVRLVGADGNEVNHLWSEGDFADSEGGLPRRVLLESLAALSTLDTHELTIPQNQQDSGGIFIGVVGAIEDLARDSLLRAHAPRSGAYAICLDVETWSARRPTDASSSTSAALRARGWKAVDLARGDSLAAAWKALNQ